MPVVKPVALVRLSPNLHRQDTAGGEWFLPNKLTPPHLHTDALPREHLLAQLNKGLSVPLTLLLAPPGFGKTTLLTQWHMALQAHHLAHVAWLSLDKDDAKPARLLAYLALALRLDTQLSNQHHLDQLDLAEARTALLQAIGCLHQSFALILDDYDQAACPETDEIISLLVEHSSPKLHIILSTRCAPALPLSRLAVRGALHRIEANQLALSHAETSTLLGTDYHEQASQLWHKTEGWPVAVQLAAQWFSSHQCCSENMAQFSGRTANFAAYLAEQVIHDLEADVHLFLLETACLARFNAALADAVRQRQDSGRLLAGLNHFDGLLLPLDDDRAWFRYHPLFAEFLYQQLGRESPSLSNQLHRRASQWHATQGNLPEAIHHALQAQDIPLAAAYVAQAGNWQMLLRHGASKVHALLCQFDTRVIRDTPALNLTQACLFMWCGQLERAQMLLDRFQVFAEELRTPLARDYTVLVALLRHFMDQICSHTYGIAQLSSQAQALDQDDDLGRGLLLCICAATAIGRGEFAQADGLGQLSYEVFSLAQEPLGKGYALLQIGQSQFYRGLLDLAENTYQQALKLTQTYRSDDLSLTAACHCLLAQLQLERGRYDIAADLIEGQLETLEQVGGWTDLYIAGFSTALTLARQRDRSGRDACTLLDKMDALATRRHLSRLADLATAWRLEVLLDLPHHETADVVMERSGGEAAFAHAHASGYGWQQAHALGFSLARWHAQAGRTSAALALLHRQYNLAETLNDHFHLPRIQLRMALVLQQRGEIELALTPLNAALDYIATMRTLLIALEIGTPIKSLLRNARQHDPEASTGTTRALIIQTLLEKFSDDEAQTTQLFSERELEVLQQLARGHSNKQIARQLVLSENTVKFHLKNLYRKLEANTRGAALGQALQRGLITHSQMATPSKAVQHT